MLMFGFCGWRSNFYVYKLDVPFQRSLQSNLNVLHVKVHPETTKKPIN